MPKDWGSIKGELERLYITEGRPLEQVRETLLATHGFDASTRMYRFKLVQWGIRKNKSNNECGGRCSRGQRATSPTEPEEPDLLKDADILLLMDGDQSQPHNFWNWLTNEQTFQPSSVHNASQDANVTSFSSSSTKFEPSGGKAVFGYPAVDNPNSIPSASNRLLDGRIPSRPMRLSELLPLIQHSYTAEHAFEPLLRKWQSDGEYMNCAITWLKDPAYCKNILGSSQTGGNHFKLIDENVPYPERLTLTKNFLKASIVHNVRPSGSLWSVVWDVTRYIQNWQTVKENLFDASSGFISELGSAFHLCASVVMAEELLQDYKNQLESLRAEPLTVATSNEARTIRQQYVTILKDFRNQEVDVDISFYKYSLEVLEWNESLVVQEKNRTERLLTKYRRLVSLLTGKNTYWIDGNIDGIIGDAERKQLTITSVPFLT